jgi:hypothetical protein
MDFEEFSIHVNGAIASLKQIENLTLKVAQGSLGRITWPAEDKRMLEHHQRVLATSLGILEPLLAEQVQRTVSEHGREKDLFTLVLEAEQPLDLHWVREAIAKLRSLKGKIEPLAAAAPETPIEQLGIAVAPAPNEGRMSYKDLAKLVEETLTHFEGILEIIDPPRDSTADERRRLRKLQTSAANSVSQLDPILTRFCTRKTKLGGGMQETDMFVAALKVSSFAGMPAVGTGSEILNWVIGELRLMLAKARALAGESPNAVVKMPGEAVESEASAGHELASEFGALRSRIKSQFGQDWYFADVDNDLREIAACMDSDCCRAALSLAGRTLELVLKIHCQNHNVAFDEKHSAGQLIGVIRDSKLYVDPGLKNILDLINQQRILGVHAKTGIPIPSRSQANMVCHALLDVLKRVFRLADEPK